MTADDLMDNLAANVDLGHAARDRSFLRQVRLALESQGASLTKAAGASNDSGWADAMSLYRFLGNDAARLADMRMSRAKACLAGVPEGADVLVIHDDSVLDYSRHNSKTDRRLVGNHRGKGYDYTACIGVLPKTGVIMGMLHDTLISADGPDDVDHMDYDYEGAFRKFKGKERKRLLCNARHRTAVHIHGLNAMLKTHHGIHVADRGFDDVFVFIAATSEGHDFVIRSSGNRNVQVPESLGLPARVVTPDRRPSALPPGWTCANLRDVVRALPMQSYKSLPLDAENRVTDPQSAVRTANLSIGGCRVRLDRRAKRNKRYFQVPAPVEINLVVIRETDPPEGVDPLCWVLFTSLAIDTLEQLAWVGLCYERRWSVECYFRLVKSGYGIEESRLDDAQKTARLLVICSLAATVLCSLKQQLGLPAKGRLDDENYARLKQAMRNVNDPKIGLPVRLFALILIYGGWLGRRNDPIGPTVQMRGAMKVLGIMDAANQYADLLDEARQNPEVVRSMFGV